MKIGGFGELESIRKAIQKEEPKKAELHSKPEGPAAAGKEDAVEISSHGKIFGKLQKIPDVRKQKIEDVLKRMANGTLMTPEAVKESVAKMLEKLYSDNQNA